MKLNTLLSLAMLSGGVLLGAGCATSGHEQTVGEVIDDSAITTEVKSALLAEKDVRSFDIKVKTYNGIVQLSGFVNSQWQIDKAVEIAGAVKGVQSVRNDLIRKSR